MIVYIDTLALLYRAYYAIPDLHSSKGDPTGALYGLLNTLFRIIKEMEPDHVIACFDRPEKTFRQEVCEDYKANRELPEEEMIFQIEKAREILNSFGVHTIEKSGYEADDLLGTLSTLDAKDNKDVVIVTCDGDLLQLTTNKNIRVYLLQKGISDFSLFDEKETEKKNKYPAKNVIDYKGLRGDASDNISGVRGIGDTIARRLIEKFGDLDDIYSAVHKGLVSEKPFTKRIEKLLLDGEKDAFTSRDLATIHTNVSVKRPHTKSKKLKDRIVFEDAEAVLKEFSFGSLSHTLKLICNKDNDEKEKIDEDLLKKVSISLWVLDSNITSAKIEDIYSYTECNNLKDAFVWVLDELKKTNKLNVWEEIEKPIIPIIKKIEKIGICFDKDSAKKLSKKYHKKLEDLKEEIFDLSGKEFNVNSPKQLKEILYSHLELNPKKRNKTTKESVLLEMKDEHKIIPLILEYRHNEKLRSTYIDALPQFSDKDGKIHTHLIQNGTTTGRFSSRDPNLQNIPVGGDEGAIIRNLFVARDGYDFVSVDYSQMELRISAILSRDKTLIDVFKNNEDIHTRAAAEVFGIEEKDVTKTERNSAKTINFGILYGMGAQTLKQSLNISLSEAQEFLNEYKKAFPQLFDYLDSVKCQAREDGFVTTVFGRTRKIDNINSKLHFVRAQAERIAANSVIQGTAADIIKKAMIRVDKMIEEENLENSIRLILPIHDELLFEIKPDKIEMIIGKIKEIMESIYTANKDVPLTVDVKIGKYWGKMKPYDTI